MKKLLFTTFLLLNIFIVKSQIRDFQGIYKIDNISFDDSNYISYKIQQSNSWQVGKPTKPIFSQAFSVPNALVTDTSLYYPVNDTSIFQMRLESRYFGMVVEFDHMYNTDSLLDGGFVEVSYDRGKSWVNVTKDIEINGGLYFGSENLYEPNENVFNKLGAFTGNSNGWVHTKIQWVWVLPVRGLSDSFDLRFVFVSDSIHHDKEGWMIDNIGINYVDIGGAVKEQEHLKYPLYPNPTSTNIISTHLSNIKKIELYGQDGKFVNTLSFEENGNRTDIDISLISQGNYCLKFYLKDRSAVLRKLIINP